MHFANTSLLFLFHQSMRAMSEELLTVNEFAEKAKINIETVYRRIKDIPHVRIGRTIRIPASVLEPVSTHDEPAQPEPAV